QMPRPAATQEGLIEGPPYHCDINAMRVLFPESSWIWPKPPYDQVPHPKLAVGHVLAVLLVRR
ncbi:MAG TPA: thiopurine S-methyltransferase, partial [Aquabacterium sp.]|nr:thiopurine S-methyltransferase [Aquabacterium sp.]